MPNYRITVIPEGDSFTCGPEQRILDAAHAANVLIPYSCRQGQCGSCMVRVVTGEVAYPNGQPDALDAGREQAGYALCCSARAITDLTIELLQPVFPDQD